MGEPRRSPKQRHVPAGEGLHPSDGTTSSTAIASPWMSGDEFAA